LSIVFWQLFVNFPAACSSFQIPRFIVGPESNGDPELAAASGGGGGGGGGNRASPVTNLGNPAAVNFSLRLNGGSETVRHIYRRMLETEKGAKSRQSFMWKETAASNRPLSKNLGT
jgi:hypothetical protein